MAFTLLKRESRREQHDLDEVVVEHQQLEDARRDPRVRTFLLDADEYLAKLERDGRNG
jgi:hypothetical protein